MLLCVDNHATRRTVSRRVSALCDALLISGGSDGNLAAASAILNALLLALSGELHYPELAFDIRVGRMRPIEPPEESAGA